MSWNIRPLDQSLLPAIRQRIDQKTKPPGALGQLETLATQLALIQGKERLSLNKPVLLIFAADHGVAEEGVSIAPSAVTQQMVQNFMAGGAAANCFCRTQGVALEVIDAGMLSALQPKPEGLIEQRVGPGTRNLAHEAAMTAEQARNTLLWGAERARAQLLKGVDLLIVGEMGIGNTTAASAMMAALLDLSPSDCVGRGTGISDTQLALKQALIEKALMRVTTLEPLKILEELGGFEIGQMTGAMLAAGEAGIPVLIDGFIATTAALLAVRMEPELRHYLIFGHESGEQGHRRLLAALDAEPLLKLGMRLGEGAGAVLAVPLLRAAISFYNDMATFESAGVVV